MLDREPQFTSRRPSKSIKPAEPQGSVPKTIPESRSEVTLYLESRLQAGNVL